MNNKTEIEEDIELLKNINAGVLYFAKDEEYEKYSKAIENILADRERLEKENEELKEVEINASAHNKIEELTREKFKLKTEVENKRKEYQDTYKDVREELKELQAKANKYDSLVEKIKEKKEELEKNINTYEENEKDIGFKEFWHNELLKATHKLWVLQELLDTNDRDKRRLEELG